MPTYEYACKSCGEHLEVQQSFSDDALTDCPRCGGRLRKVFGSIGISFKGSGFYRTDSRPAVTKPDKDHDKAAAAKDGDGAKAAEKTSAASSPDSTSSSSTKSDTSSSKVGSSSTSGGDKAKAKATAAPQ